jgi:dihydrofolate reductase
MRTVIALVFDCSVDGFVATEDTRFWDYCRDLPDIQACTDRIRDLYETADLHVMGRNHYQEAAGYFPGSTDNPYAGALNAARKIVFSQTIRTPEWADSSVAAGDLGAEMEKLKLDGDGHIVAHGGLGFWRSLIRRDLIDEYRLLVVPYVAGEGARLFEAGQSLRFELASAITFGDGTTELSYRRDRRS